LKRLILVRHATAVDKGPEGSDFHRRLKKRGRRESLLMAARLRSLVDVPEQLFTSPADRALETARLFAEELEIPSERVGLREELYGGLLPEEFLHIVQRFDNKLSSVAVFGHDPSFTEFAAYLIPSFTDSIPKAGVLVIEIDRSRWKSVRAGDGRLAHFERPPAHDVQKQIDEDVLDRLVVAIRQGILSATRDLDLANSREVARLIARLSTRLARDLRPFARSTMRAVAAEAVSKPAIKSRGGRAAQTRRGKQRGRTRSRK
jgi:phosphohistidine phosphatase